MTADPSPQPQERAQDAPGHEVAPGVPDAPVGDSGAVPEHRGERRRFIVWALMLGAVKPERVVERIVADLQGDAEGRS